MRHELHIYLVPWNNGVALKSDDSEDLPLHPPWKLVPTVPNHSARKPVLFLGRLTDDGQPHTLTMLIDVFRTGHAAVEWSDDG